MPEKKLKLVKKQRKITSKKVQKLVSLTPAEQAEAERFKTFTKGKASLQAKVRQMTRKLHRHNESTKKAA